MNYLYGILEDNAGLLVGKFWSFLDAFGVGRDVLSSQPLTIDVFVLLTRFFDAVFLINVFVVLMLLLNVYFFYRLLRVFVEDKVFSVFLALLFGIAPYTIYHSQNHITLVVVWVLIFGIERILKSVTFKDYFLLGLYLAFATLMSNYYGYFLLIFLPIFMVVRYVLFKWTKNEINFKNEFFGFLISVITCVFVSGIVLIPYVRSNFLSLGERVEIGVMSEVVGGEEVEIVGDSWKLSPELVDENNNPISTEIVAKNTTDTRRTLEEFFYFTLRPWYLFLPAPDNPFFGNLTNEAISFLQNDWGYWLTTNYFPREHVAGYLGWVNFVIGLFGIYYVYIKFKKDKSDKKYLNAIILGITAIFLIIITLPPYITISLQKIYTPSYILYLIFPMFRSLARIGIMVLAIQLIFTGFGYLWIKEKLQITKLTKYKYLLFVPFFVISFMEFYMPPVITDVSTPPQIFTYIKNNTPNDSKIAIYPGKESARTIFWVKEYQRQFVNPSYYIAPKFGFDANDFTNNLYTCQGLLEARNLGVDYLIYTKPNNPTKNDLKKQNYFQNTLLLTKISQFDDNGWILFQINQDIDYQKQKSNCIEEINLQKSYNTD